MGWVVNQRVFPFLSLRFPDPTRTAFWVDREDLNNHKYVWQIFVFHEFEKTNFIIQRDLLLFSEWGLGVSVELQTSDSIEAFNDCVTTRVNSSQFN